MRIRVSSNSSGGEVRIKVSGETCTGRDLRATRENTGIVFIGDCDIPWERVLSEGIFGW